VGLLSIALIAFGVVQKNNSAKAGSYKGNDRESYPAIIWGWILTIIGGIGTIISLAVYSEAESDYRDRFYSYYSNTKSVMQVAQIAEYVCIGIAVLGIVLLIVGYISKSSRQNRIAQNEILKQLANNSPQYQPQPQAQSADKIICPNCNCENSGGSKFCNNCGAKLQAVKICSDCGAENKSGARFCSSCGKPLQ
jgi:uncharacterized membrane protein YidH (DUF202 family)